MKQFLILIFFFNFTLSANQIQLFLKSLDNIKTLKADIIIDDRLNGILYYKYPNQIHIKLSDGRIIASDGTFLWFYSPLNNIAGKQQLEKEQGYGIKGLFSNYTSIKTLNPGEFKLTFSNKRLYPELIFSLDQKSNFLRLLIMKNKKKEMVKKFIFSNIILNLGLSTNLFSYNPNESVQVVTNPLNN